MIRKCILWAALAAVLVLGSGAAAPDTETGRSSRHVHVLDINGTAGTFTVQVDTVGAAELLVAAPGENRIIHTYAQPESAAQPEFTVAAADFDYAFGTYILQAFSLDKDGNRGYLGASSVSLRPPGGGLLTVTPADAAESCFEAVLDGSVVPAEAPVWFCVWPNQENAAVRIYPARRQNGCHQATIPAAGYQAGRCQVAAYSGIPGKAQAFLQSARFTISGAKDAHLLVSPLPQSPGQFSISVAAESPAGLRSVRAAVWSEPGQEDIVWYDMTPEGALWTARGNIAQHHHNMGSYQVHIWAELGNGVQTLAAATTQNIVCRNYSWTERGSRNYEIYVRNPVTTPVRTAVWSNTGGQDDIVWYQASQVRPDLWKTVVNLRRHRGSGSYTAHSYAGTVCIPAAFTVSEAEKQSVQELRGLWVPSVSNLDFPTVRGAAAQQQEFRQIVRNAADWGFNALFIQVRPHADALYESSINPWSDLLTGVYDKHPGYDPLSFMIRTAHQEGIELHAWLNPYRVCDASAYEKLSARSVGRQHPDWLLWYSKSAYLDPAKPEVRAHIAATVQEIIDKYEVDGIHFDDYFYPYRYPLPDGEPRDGAVGDARRENVTQMVRDVSAVVRSSPRQISFGISPFGVWKNSASDPAGSNTFGQESYYSNYCDTLTWIREGLIDYVAPQIYWHLDHPEASYRILVDWWAQAVRGTDVELIVGHGIYKGEVAAEIREQLMLNDTYGEVCGSIYYRYMDIRNNPALAATLTEWNRSRS